MFEINNSCRLSCRSIVEVAHLQRILLGFKVLWQSSRENVTWIVIIIVLQKWYGVFWVVRILSIRCFFYGCMLVQNINIIILLMMCIDFHHSFLKQDLQDLYNSQFAKTNLLASPCLQNEICRYMDLLYYGLNVILILGEMGVGQVV